MEVFKLGCTWGPGKPNFYQLLINKKFVVGIHTSYAIGDLVLLADGFKVQAICKISSEPVEASSKPELEADFKEYKIGYDEDTKIYQGTIYELTPEEQFQYNMRQGNVHVRQKDIIEKAKDIFKQKEDNMKIEEYYRLLKQKKQIILQGAPGTGKTYISAVIALSIINDKVNNYDTRKDLMKDYKKAIDNELIGFTTFHQSMDYEEFVEGFKPTLNNSKIAYEVKDGIFKRMSIKAQNDKGHNYVLIIDEINRGNVSKIFGELITLLENDKRLDAENEIRVTLPYSKEKLNSNKNETFGVPSNLYIIATMNTADRSVGHIDYAVRRRFAFITLLSEKGIVENFYNPLPKSKSNEVLSISQKAISLYEKVENIMEKISPDFSKEDLMIGHSYFMAKTEEELKMKLDYEIKPLLMEYAKDGVLFMTSEDMMEITDLSI